MTDLKEWARDFAERQRTPEAASVFTERTLHRIEQGVPDAAGTLAPLLEETIRQHWQAFLGWFFADDPFELVPAARELAAELARRHLGLPVLLALYRNAQDASWDYATSVVQEAPRTLDHEKLLIWLWTRAGEWFSASVDQSVLIHQQEAARIQQHGDTQRYEAVLGVLEGRAEDPRALSAALDGYPVGGSHLALIARARGADTIRQLEPALAKTAAALSRGHLAVVRPGGREVWAWLPAGSSSVAGPEGAAARERLARLGLDSAALRVSVGGPAAGAGGFTAAHRDARAALPVALAPGRCEPVTFYDDVAPLAMLATVPESAGRFSRRTLGALADQTAGKLRETVRAVLQGEGDAETVAAGLGIHKNTVRYRVGQAERLLGLPVRARARDLLLALDYYDAFLAAEDSDS